MKDLINIATGEAVAAADDHADELVEAGTHEYVPADEFISDEAPAKNSKRDVWDAYAESKGLDPADFDSKDELIEAVEAL